MPARDHFRAHGRIRVDLEATLLDQEGLARSVTIRDLSLAGAGVELQDATELSQNAPELVPETPVTLELVTPTLWDPLRLNGTIAWIRRSTSTARTRTRAGIRFEHQEATSLLGLFHVL